MALSLAIPRVTIAGRVGFPPTYVGAMLRATVPPHPFFMVDSGIRIKPNDDIFRAMRLSGALGRKQRQLRSVILRWRRRPLRGLDRRNESDTKDRKSTRLNSSHHD